MNVYYIHISFIYENEKICFQKCFRSLEELSKNNWSQTARIKACNSLKTLHDANPQKYKEMQNETTMDLNNPMNNEKIYNTWKNIINCSKNDEKETDQIIAKIVKLDSNFSNGYKPKPKSLRRPSAPSFLPTLRRNSIQQY